MYVANTHLKPVIGIDIHFVNLPFPFVPLPHPYIGLVIDPFDYIPFIGATVKVNNVPRGNTDTAGLIITFIHIPFGAGFTLVPMIGHDSSNFFGSKTVQLEGAPMSGAGYILMTCNDIGIPLSFSPGKKFKPIPSLYLPTSFCIPLQWGNPVMVGGPMVPHLSLMAILKAFAFGSFLKGFGKLGGKMLKKLNGKLAKSGASGKVKSALCKMGFEPVDLITGRVNYELTDFELPGPIPVRWTRTWDSDATIKGPLGHGVQLSYDRCVRVWPEEGCLSVTLADGRLAVFPMLHYGESFYHPQEKLLLRRKQNGHYLLEDYVESLYYHFNHDIQPGIWKLSLIENYSGNRIQLHYTDQSLCAITDSAGRQLLFTLDKQQRITQVAVKHRDMEQILVTYDYNEEGDLVSIADALNQVTTMEYRYHLMIKKTDRNGQCFYWEYDSKKRCIHTWGDGGVLEGYIKYGKGFNIVTNSLDETTTYYYNEDNLCVQQTDHYGHSKYFEYTENFDIYRLIDEEGNITGYSYDEQGRVKEKILPDGNRVQFNYNDRNQLTMILYPNGNSQTLGYDDRGRVRFVNAPNGRSITYKYNVKGQLEVVIDNDNQKSHLAYDEDQNLISVQPPNGTPSYWKYDALGRCTQTINTNGEIRNFEYDPLNRMRKLHFADGNTLKLEYDAYDEVIQASDKQESVRFEYTPLGKLKKRSQRKTEFQLKYDTEERLCTVINEDGRYYNFGYNKRGEVISETTFDGLKRQYERSAAGKVMKVLRPGGRYASYEYDPNGRVTRIAYHDGSWEIFSYDKSGNLKEAMNEHSTVRFTRNKMGDIVTEEQNGYTVYSTYDKQGNRIRITSNAGADIQLHRNETGQVTTMQAAIAPGPEALQETGSFWQAQIKYNQLGVETERILPGGLTSQWQYDQAGLPGEHKVNRKGVVQSWKKYTWNTSDRLTQIFDALSQTNTQFKYDTLGNLVFAQYASNSIIHRAFDATGNIYETAAKTDRTYNAAGALLESKKYTYKYDDEGNLISKTPKSSSPAGSSKGKKMQYEWYANGMLKKVLQPEKEVEFKYDAFGRRIEKLVVNTSANNDNTGTVTRWVWDNHVALHEWSYNNTEKPVTVVDEWGDIHYDKKEPVDNMITWVYDADSFVPAARIQNGQSHSILSDYLGTPEAAYDENGKRVWESVLDIYGRTRTIQGEPGFIPFRYQGQYEDAETGLYYNRYRYYNAEEGVYTSPDPIGLSGGFNVYAYTHNTTTQTDPFGLSTTTGTSTRYVYRSLTQFQEVQAKAGLPLTPKGPNATYTIQNHIEDGKLDTQYISTGKELKTAEFYAKPNPKYNKTNPSMVIKVDTTKIKPENLFDCADGIDPQTGKPLLGKALGWAMKDKEVLILGGIPADAYEIVSPPSAVPTTCKK